ncbi:MAG: glycosyltransferase family 2 protein [Thermoanaerobaculia bacterium]|nr:glycosyltransferase family 2 protein [Thermoanaerobaculia bacterium]
MRTVSVIIAAWNRARELRSAIDSAFAQTFPPLEVIVVDDGSTDETPEVLAQYCERYGDRIRVLRQSNQGVAAARNAGIAVARGDQLAFLDSDDVWLPRKLELQVARFDADPQLGLVHCGADFEGTGVNVDGMEGWVATELLRFDRSVIVAHGSGVMVPKRVAEELGGFDARMRVSEDWDFCYRVAARYRIGFVAEALVLYARHASGLHGDIAKMEHGMLLALEKAFADPVALPLRRHAYGRLHRILSGCYFQQRQWRAFIRHFVKSVRWDWRNVAYFAAYPLRRTRLRRTPFE